MAAIGSKAKCKKPPKRSKKANALEDIKGKKVYKVDKKSDPCESFITPQLDCPPTLRLVRYVELARTL